MKIDPPLIFNRYHAALKAKESSNSKDLPAAEAKAEQLKTQYEDEMAKFEASKVWILKLWLNSWNFGWKKKNLKF